MSKPRDEKDTLLCKLARYYASLSYDDVPAEVIEKAKRSLVDFLSELAAGFYVGELAEAVNPYLVELGGKPESTLLCVGRKMPAQNAALGMGVMAHAIELDDGHRWGTSHPAVAIMPAVLAMAEREKSSYGEILLAIVIGYDMMLRTARAINPAHLKKGFHSTGTCGSLGAAAACAKLLNLDEEKTAYAISMGGLQSAGLQEMLHDHPGVKPLQPGKSASAGVLAADLAKRGAKSPRTLFEGEHGWLKAMCDSNYSAEALIGDLGTRFEILYTYTKLYPTCRHCHAAIDLAREARETLSCDPADIEYIEVKTYRLGIVEVGRIQVPKTQQEAMFSLPFAVAIALTRGNVTLQDYTPETLSDPKLISLAEKVHVIEDEKLNDLYPEERGAHMKVVLRDGRSFEKYIPVAKGEPEFPVTDEDLKEKLQAMLSPYYPNAFFEGLWKMTVEGDIESRSYEEIIEHFGRFCS